MSENDPKADVSVILLEPSSWWVYPTHPARRRPNNVRAIARPVAAMFEYDGAVFRTYEPAESVTARMFEEVRLDDLAVRGAVRRKRQIEGGAANQLPGIKRLIPFEEVIPGAFDAAIAVFIVLR